MAVAIGSNKELEGEVSRWLAPSALVGLILIFTLVVSGVSFSMRNDIREQFMSRDSHVLNLIVQNQIVKSEEENLLFDFEALGENELWESLLESAGERGVFGVQLFSVAGAQVRSSSESLVMRSVLEETLATVKAGEAVSVFELEMAYSEFMDNPLAPEGGIATLSIYLPLTASIDGELLGVARYLLDGRVLADEFDLLDARLISQASVAVGGGSVLMFGLFWLAWWRLKDANVRVLKQARRLEKTNRELAMLARTSAVGSVTAHLIHGLKNPLAGLQQVVSGAREGGAAEPDAEDWKGATEAANRMQAMVQEVVALLQDSASATDFDMTLSELKAEVFSKFSETARSSGIDFQCESFGDGSLSNHRYNIVLLIVSNLARNALDAVATGGSVDVSMTADDRNLVLTVGDSGPGVSESYRDDLFSPVQSSKAGGAGIGLAISMQMARHIGARLQYLDTRKRGALFELVVPLRDGTER